MSCYLNCHLRVGCHAIESPRSRVPCNHIISFYSVMLFYHLVLWCRAILLSRSTVSCYFIISFYDVIAVLTSRSRLLFNLIILLQVLLSRASVLHILICILSFFPFFPFLTFVFPSWSFYLVSLCIWSSQNWADENCTATTFHHLIHLEHLVWCNILWVRLINNL